MLLEGNEICFVEDFVVIIFFFDFFIEIIIGFFLVLNLIVKDKGLFLSLK